MHEHRCCVCVFVCNACFLYGRWHMGRITKNNYPYPIAAFR